MLKDIPKELNTKTYIIMVKKKEGLNQWLNKQLKIELIMEPSSRYTVSYSSIQ